MKKWILALFIPALAAAHTPTPESSCTELDFRNDRIGAVRNQGDVAWCYAFTSADILQHTFGLDQKISAADVALNYNETPIGRVMDVILDNGNPHETGFSKVAMNQTMKEGYCPEELFPSEKWIKVKGDKEEAVLLSQALVEIKDLHSKRNYLNLRNLPFYYKFKNVGKEEFLDMIKTEKLYTFFKNLRNTVCLNDRVPFDVRWKSNMVLRHQNIFWRVNEQLNLGRLVALDYDGRVLENKNNQRISLEELHTSSIVGRRWNKTEQSCQYLIRDSFGKDCSQYDSRLECSEGYLWLNEGDIFRNMTSVVYLLSGRN